MKKRNLVYLALRGLPGLNLGVHGFFELKNKIEKNKKKSTNVDNDSIMKTETYLSIISGTIATFLGAKEVRSLQDKILKSFEVNEQNKVKFRNERDRIIQTIESNGNKIHIYDCIDITNDFLDVMGFNDVYEKFDSMTNILTEDNEEAKSQELYKWICTLQEGVSKR